MLWMVVLSVLLFWLPTLGPLIAGFVGGRRAGGVGPALGAAVIPAVIVSALIFLAGAVFDLPVIGGLVGTGVLIVILVVVFVWRGPKTLPKIGQALGRGVREARSEAAKITDRKDDDPPA